MLGVDADHMLVLRDGQVTSRTLLDSVSWLAAHAAPDAVAGFFYAGHVRKTNGGNEEIVTSDGSAVTDAQLANALEPCRRQPLVGRDRRLLRRRVHRGASPRSGAHRGGGRQRSGVRELEHRPQLHGLLHDPPGDHQRPRVGHRADRVQLRGRPDRAGAPGQEPSRSTTATERSTCARRGQRGAAAIRAAAVKPSTPPTTEPPAGDRPPSGGQKCTGSGLFRICNN